MLRIAVCDDDQQICRQIETIILASDQQKLMEIAVESYFSGETLWADLQKGLCYDLIFLDIEMAELSGIDIGQKIRNELANDVMQIVYISREPSHAMALFDVQPMNFLLKPLEEEKIMGMISKVAKIAQTHYFAYHKGKNVFKIPLQDIMYFSSKGREIAIHLRMSVVEEDCFYGKLLDIAQEINDERFMLIHKSYLVNYDYIKEYQYDTVVLTNGLILGISQSQRPIIRDKVRRVKRGEIF